MDTSKILAGAKISTTTTTPMYLQIANIIMEKIQAHLLPAGAKLPPERELALLFDVSRTTAINAYRYLEQQGIVETKVGSGTYISGQPSTTVPLSGVPWSQLFIPTLPTPMASIIKELISTQLSNNAISLAAGLPDPALYPVDVFNSLFAKHIQHLPNTDLGYIPTEGYPSLRSSIAAMMQQKGVSTTPEKTLILSGSQQGLYLIAKVFLNPGDYVIVQSPTYLGAIQDFQAAGARILSFPATDTLPLNLLEDYLIRYRPKLLYILSTFQNPTGRVLTLEERHALLQLAAKHSLVIVEDDPYGELYYKEPPPPPLVALDHYGGVIYLSTFSKIIFPGLRTGWLIAPEAVINRVALEKQHVDLHTSNLSQWLLDHYLQTGLLSDHLTFIRAEYKKRRDAAIAAIRRYCNEALSFKTVEGGFYLWCKIEQPVTSRTLLHEAAKSGVSFVPGEAFYPDASGEQEFRLCFATYSEETITEGIKRLGKCLTNLAKDNHPAKRGITPLRPII